MTRLRRRALIERRQPSLVADERLARRRSADRMRARARALLAGDIERATRLRLEAEAEATVRRVEP
jgi:hypothetical protein